MSSRNDAQIQQTIVDEVNRYAAELKELSLYIWENPELAYKEEKAHARLADYLERQGFTVERHFHLTTAFRATFIHREGGPTIGFNSEYDSLPGIGHACGHNLIAIGGVAAAMGTIAAMKLRDIPGKVVLLGTPAEEGGAGKVKLLEAGAYNEMDICMMQHPAGLPAGLKGAIGVTSAIQTIEVEYFGKPAHAAAAPWDGINALDAAVLAYSSLSAMRQQLQPTDRIHGIIEHGGDAPNVIPRYTKLKYYARAAHLKALENLKAKVLPCFNAAATATGCTVQITTDVLTNDLRNCPTLTAAYATTMKELYGIDLLIQTEPSELSGGSTDFGNVSYALPSLHPLVGIPITVGHNNHTPGFTEHARTDEAHDATFRASTALAIVACRALVETDFIKEARHSWEETIRKVGAEP